MRIKGELYLWTLNERMAETCWQQAIQIARQQKAKSWELKATNKLCHLWLRQGKKVTVQRHLANICAWFGDGLMTPDLQEARDLLALLKPETAVNDSDLSSLQKTHIEACAFWNLRGVYNV